jgi:hypothetical protein
MTGMQKAVWIAYLLVLGVCCALAVSGPPRDIQAAAAISLTATAYALVLHHLLKRSERPRV